MFRVSSKFGVAFLALALTALVSILAACGDSSSTSSGGGDSSSSRVIYSSIAEPSKDTIEIMNFAANPNPMHTSVRVSGEIVVNEENDELEYYYIQFDGKKIGNNATEPTINISYDFAGQEYCSASDESVQVQLFVKLKSRPQPQNMKNIDFTREWSICRPPSSASAPSSSSADTRQFISLSLDGQTTLTLNALTGVRGVSFSSTGGTGKTNTSEAHIYYEKSGQQASIKAGSGVNIVQAFTGNPEKGCKSGERYRYKTPDNFVAGEIGNPQNNIACFGLTAENEQSLGFYQGKYFVVRTNGASGTQWTANDYLVAFEDEKDPTLNTAKIVAWKLQ